MQVSIIGLGFVGGAMLTNFREKKINVLGYDLYKDSDSFEKCLKTDIMFLCLPTQFNESTKQYDKLPIYETCHKLIDFSYSGIVVIKSTVEPETTQKLSQRFKNLKFVHNPEFLTAATAYQDFSNQKHIVLGRGPNLSVNDIEHLTSFYQQHFPLAEISHCSSLESESMKSFCNCFYAVKIQFCNELYLTCQKNGSDYNKVMELMLKNNWINPMHTKVPGTDGKLSYGGYCFPKDTQALLQYMKRNNTSHRVLESVITERDEMRKDKTNIINNLKK